MPYTQSHQEGQGGEPKSKKKWFIGGGVLLLLIVAVVVIVVVVTGGKSKDNGGGDKPTPPEPPHPTPPVIGFNPYYVEENATEKSNGQLTGLLRHNASVGSAEYEAWARSAGYGMVGQSHLAPQDNLFFKSIFNSSKEDVHAGERVGVDSQKIAGILGENNHYVERVRYTFGQVDYKRTVLSISDEDDDSRFEIPEELVARQVTGPQFRLDMVDF